MTPFNLKVLTPNKVCIDEEVLQVTIFTPAGYCSILHNHAPIVGAVTTNFMIIKTKSGKNEKYIANKGIFCVTNEGTEVLLDFFEPVENFKLNIFEERNRKIAEAFDVKTTSEKLLSTKMNTNLEKELFMIKKLLKR